METYTIIWNDDSCDGGDCWIETVTIPKTDCAERILIAANESMERDDYKPWENGECIVAIFLGAPKPAPINY